MLLPNYKETGHGLTTLDGMGRGWPLHSFTEMYTGVLVCPVIEMGGVVSLSCDRDGRGGQFVL